MPDHMPHASCVLIHPSSRSEGPHSESHSNTSPSNRTPRVSSSATREPYTGLLPQVLKRHTGADDENPAEENPAEAPETLLAALACAHSFVSSTAGIEAALRADGALLRCLCSALRWQDTDASRMALEMLCNMCVYSETGYRTALQVCTPLAAGSMPSVQVPHERAGSCREAKAGQAEPVS